MKHYQSHKVVQAARIADVIGFLVDGVQLVFDDGDKVTKDAAWSLRFEPQPGQYYVVYEDGYASISPADAFEGGYRLTSPKPVADSEIPNEGPRITPADVEAQIASEHYFVAGDGVYGAARKRGDDGVQAFPGALDLLTICVLVLKNGFTVTGESACASPENFREDIGNRIARENAVRKVWPLMGYQLRTALSNTPPPINNAFVAPGCEQFEPPSPPTTFQDRVRTERAELAEKVEKLTAFRATERWADVHPSEQFRLRAQLGHMENYLQILDDRIAGFEPVEA